MTKIRDQRYEMSELEKQQQKQQHHQSAEEFAIDVNQVVLSYGWRSKVHVLEGLSLQLPRGNIYGLLGPSGCGKTSLIRCILGMTQIGGGSIRVFGEEPGSGRAAIPGSGVGYMPQDISLYPDLTIRETLQYFAFLYGMTGQEVEERGQFLGQLLNLPDKNRFVGQCSGGQKRRVSLATALIHKPPLLILDEPTVGVDPLLRKSIWNHLTELSRTDYLTVLITTHYIEEAKDANFVGLMRNGKILEQDDPNKLLVKYQMNSLEAVFLHLCTTEEAKKSHQKVLTAMAEADAQHAKLTPASSNSSGIDSIDIQRPRAATKVFKVPVSPLKQIGTQVVKNSRKLIRSPGYLLFQFMLPMVEVILFCLCLGLDINHNPVSVYDGDNSLLSRDFLAQISTKVIDQKHYTTEAAAIDAVRAAKVATALIIYPGFMELLIQRATSSGSVSNETMYNSTIHLHPDMSNQMQVQFIQKEVLTAFMTASRRLLTNMSMSTSMAELPVVLDTPIYGHNNAPFTEYMAPGVMLGLSFFSSISLTTMNLIIERKLGLIERTNVAGVSHFSILFSQILTNSVILVAQNVSLLVTIFVVFKIPYAGSLFWITVLNLLQSLTGMCFGLLISVIADTENTATMLALGVFYPIMLLAGSMWPIDAMNKILQYISYALPEAIPIMSLRAIMVRGWGITRWEVYSGFLVTIGWIAIFLILSTLVLKFKK